NLPEIVRRPVDRQEAEQAEKESVQRAIDDVDAFPLLRFPPVGRSGLARILADAAKPHDSKRAKTHAKPEIDDVVGVQVDEANQKKLCGNTDRKRDTVAKQGLHKRYVDVERKLVVSSFGHTGLPQ